MTRSALTQAPACSASPASPQLSVRDLPTGERAIGRREQGKGVIGFIVALVVIMFAGNALFQAFKVKNRGDNMTDFVRQALGEAQQMGWDTDKLRLEIVKKAKEIGAPIPAGDEIEIDVDQGRWRVHFEWDDTMTIPGYTHTWHFVVDDTWKRF